MAKELVLAVAGSGKTSKVLDAISEDKRCLVITYTNENLRSLEAGLVEKFGVIPKTVTLLSYFSFLYSFCYRPFFSYQLRDQGVFWEAPGAFPTKSNIRHYITGNGFLYGNRLAKLIRERGGLPKVISRLEEFFDLLLIDEVQDFAANDFNLLMALSNASVDMLFVGDFFQHTFDTSRDGNIRTNLHKRGLGPYIEEFKTCGFTIDSSSLEKTHRCSPVVCTFISKELGVAIDSHRADDTAVHIVEDKELACALFADDSKVKLFFQDHGKYPCASNNWGKCKGLNGYGDVCVVLNKKSAEFFMNGKLRNLPNSSLNKLYVACSRANGDLYILFEDQVRHLKVVSG